MSDTIKMEDLVEKEVDPTSEPTEEVEAEEEVQTETEAEPEQDPLKTELERVQKVGRTEKEKAEFSLRKNAERVKALGGDPNSILGIEEDNFEEEDDQPVTLGMLKKMQQESAAKTALQQAEEISNETERELVKYHLQNSIRSTGNPTEDLKLARALVNAVKNTKIIEEATRKSPAKTHSSGNGSPAKDNTVKGELTEQEKVFLGKPFNLSREAIIAAREKSK